jgi:preprotein translocase subunit SecG
MKSLLISGEGQHQKAWNMKNSFQSKDAINLARAKATNPLDYLTHRYVVIFILWSLLYYYFIKIEFGAVYFIVTVLVAIFINLNYNSQHSKDNNKDRKKKPLSAYSVFNANCESIEGSVTAQQLEAQITHRPIIANNSSSNNNSNQANKQFAEHYDRASKHANKPCVCGSGKKYKNCCSKLTAPSKQQINEMKQWEDEWT